MKEYVAPPWAAPAPADGQHYELEVVKEGVVLEKDRLVLVESSHKVTSASHGFFLVGRQDDVVDFVMAHASISRVHAVFQYRQDGALMLLDMGSAQGTFINKKACSREGVYERLYVGDMIKFGASTRQYVVQGPSQQSLEEYDSENLRAYRARLADAAARAQDKLEISWGMRDDDDHARGGGGGADYDYDDDGAKAGELLLPDDLPDYLRNDQHYAQKFGRRGGSDAASGAIAINEADFQASDKDRAVLDKIRVKQRKLEHMQTETRQIQVKEAAQEDGLTEGQLKTVARNERAVEQLTAEIQDLVRSVRDKRKQRQGSAQGGGQGSSSVKAELHTTGPKPGKELDSESDVLDETSANAAEYSETNWRGKKTARGGVSSAGGSTTAWTHESLLKEVAVQQPILEGVRAQMLAARDVLAANDVGEGREREESDEIVRREVCKEARDKLLRLEGDEAKLVLKLASLERLVAIAAPALPSLSRSLVPPPLVAATAAATATAATAAAAAAAATAAAATAATATVAGPVIAPLPAAAVSAAAVDPPFTSTAVPAVVPAAAIPAATAAPAAAPPSDVPALGAEPAASDNKRKHNVAEATPAPATKPNAKRSKKTEEVVFDTHDEWRPPSASAKDANAAAAARAAKLGY